MPEELDTEGMCRLAVALVHDMVDVLKRRPPPKRKPPGEDSEYWRSKWVWWYRDRARDLAFLESRASTIWCEAAGLDRDLLALHLRRLGLLYPPYLPDKLANHKRTLRRLVA